MNPIEPSFNLLKRWVKRNQKLAPRYGETGHDEAFREFLNTACIAFSTTADHKQLWRNAGLNVDEVDIEQ